MITTKIKLILPKLVSSFLVCVILLSCSSKTLYFIRHAEKIDNSKDPDLSPSGYARAEMLAVYFDKKKIKAIYSTNYQRTLNTVAPLSFNKRIEIELYNTPNEDSTRAFCNKIIKKKGAKLIVGHSNTLRPLINTAANKILIEQDLGDLEYNKLFVLKKGKLTILEHENLR